MASTCCVAVDGADPVRASVVDSGGGVVRFGGRGEADALASHLAAAAVTLDDVDRKDASQPPQPPIATSTLQQAASSLLKLSVSDTMAMAQLAVLLERGRLVLAPADRRARPQQWNDAVQTLLELQEQPV